MRHLLFHRDFISYTGGHGKVWDYFTHARTCAGWRASVYLTPRSTPANNPWLKEGVGIADAWTPGMASALFLGGLDWRAYPADDPRRPVINLIQHVRHADRDNELFAFLSRRAVRICVSQPVADAILATGRVNGPVLVTPAALDLGELPTPPPLREGIFIGALKQPGLGRELAGQLRAAGHEVILADRLVPRSEYLATMSRCQIAILLPDATEGFYLPALEAMALGCATIVPDCVGNRAYLRTGQNAVVPAPTQEELVAAAIGLAADPARQSLLSAAGVETAQGFALGRERDAFHQLLSGIDSLWLA